MIFFLISAFCRIFQTEKIIGTGRLQDDLYILDRSQIVTRNQAAFKNTKVNQEILQLHRRLGHPFFFTSKKLYSNLFRRPFIDSLFCYACELPKHKKSFYHMSNNKNSTLFMIIHYDIWGSTQNINLVINDLLLLLIVILD